MVNNVDFVMLSNDRCCVIVLVFLKIERKLCTTKKSIKWFVLTPLHQKKTFVSVNVPKSYVGYILLWKFCKSQLQVPHHQNSSQLYHNLFTPIKHGSIKEAQNQYRHEDCGQQKSQWVHWVNGSIAAGARVVDAATISGANAAGDPTIKVDVANTTNVATAGEAIAATAAAAGNAIAATPATANNAIADTAAATDDAIAATAYATDNAVEATMATVGDTAYKAHTADAAAFAGANAASNFTIKVNILNTTDAATTVHSVTATADATGDGVKVTSGMITTEITNFKDTDLSSLVRVSIHTCRALLYIESLLLSHYKIILNFNNFTHIS